MKDEHDKKTGELLPFPASARHAATVGAKDGKPKLQRLPKRLPHQSAYTPPQGAKPEHSGQPLGFGRSVVPVSSVARDWGISSRRVRSMLAEGRLAGRQLENGYWEVFYPYSYVFGTRGPAIKRQRGSPVK